MKKKKKVLVLSILFLTIISIILLYYYNKIDKYHMDNEALKNYENYEKKQFENKIFLTNYSEFYFKYSGNVSTSDISEKMYEIFHKKIPELYSERSELLDKTEEYYEKNAEVLNNLGIENKESLEKLLKTLNGLHDEKLVFSRMEVISSSCKKYSDRTEFDANVIYNQESDIKVKITIFNVKKYNNFIKINAMMEE